MTEIKGEATDQQLVVRVQEGDKRAFDLLVLKYQHKVHAIVGRFVRDTDEVADVVQEAFIKAYRALPKFRGESQFYTWLYRIARNAGVDYTRRKNNRPEYLFTKEFPPDESLLHPRVTDDLVVRLAEASEIDKEIKKAIAELSPRQQQVFVLRYYEDLPLSEIADILGLRVGSIKAHLFNAIRNLRKHLKPYVE